MSAAGVLLEIAVKTSIVLCVALVATHLMARRAAGAARHVVWIVALAAALCMPLLVLFGPTWRIAALPGDWATGVRAVVGSSFAGSRADADVWPVTPASGTHAPLVAEAGRRSEALGRSRDWSASATPGLANWFAADLAVRAWAVGAVIALVSLLVGLMWAAWFVRRAAPPLGPEWAALQADAMARMGVTARARLLMSEHVGVPVACGVFRSVILLPVDADSWQRERRTVVLLHELAHVKRRDCLVQAFAHVAWALHWYNPLVFVAVSRLRAEQERACDDLVLRAGTPAADYAGHLCEIASTARRVLLPVWSTLAIARPSRLTGRVTAILDETRHRQAPSWRFCAAAIGVVSLGAVPLAAVHGTVATQAMTIPPTAPLTATSSLTTLMPMLIPGNVRTAGAGIPPDAEPAPAAPMPGVARAPAQEVTAESGRAFLEGCMSCHNSTRRTANLAFDELVVEPPGDHVEVWEKIVRRLRTGLHPPAGLPRPTRAAAEAFSASVEAAIDRADHANWAPGLTEPLSDREIATRLAKFLWNAEPDAALNTMVANGSLRDPARLQQQVRRMLADSKADAFLTGFFGGLAAHEESLGRET